LEAHETTILDISTSIHVAKEHFYVGSNAAT